MLLSKLIAKAVGVDLFVLDDGCFGKRNDDVCGDILGSASVSYVKWDYNKG